MTVIIAVIKTERLGNAVRQAVLSLSFFALILTTAGCGGGYRTPSGVGSSPSIASLTPTSGPVGTSVTIYGANFGASQGTSTVTFNGTAATPPSWSATTIAAPRPPGATTGDVVGTLGGKPSTLLTSSSPTTTPSPPTT